MPRPSALVLLPFLAAAAAGGEHAVFLEVRNAGSRRFQHVAERRVPLAKLFPDSEHPFHLQEAACGR